MQGFGYVIGNDQLFINPTLFSSCGCRGRIYWRKIYKMFSSGAPTNVGASVDAAPSFGLFSNWLFRPLGLRLPCNLGHRSEGVLTRRSCRTCLPQDIAKKIRRNCVGLNSCACQASTSVLSHLPKSRLGFWHMPCAALLCPATVIFFDHLCYRLL